MDNLLQGLEHVVVYIDNILITGRTEEEHLCTLDKVLQILEEAGMHLKKKKCVFMVPSVEYLSHCISKEELQPMDDKVRAVLEAPQPTNVSELKAFLGIVNHYGKSMQNLLTVLAPLHMLLKKNTYWRWQADQERAFNEARNYWSTMMDTKS